MAKIYKFPQQGIPNYMTEEYIDNFIYNAYAEAYEDENTNLDEDAWQRGREFSINQLTENEQGKESSLLARLAKKLFA